ncbi:hypothetical protein CUJ83_10660 [Methanocella sp. CWC-04]|uniref:Uncharacterized protein n=1 Tax=Methanooceanicella nereidis TaxID=2052831 RepID=A0AAP2RF69_9EURY|nr:hypothetical protein [Methanocella sp. CWC-04]MCD1295460.1 hypothetical protein [Methanocella sp. CWC-04]
MKKLFVSVLLLSSFLAISGCCCLTDIPIYVPVDDNGGEDVKISYEQVSKAEMDASNKSVTDAAGAIDAQDKQAFLSLMSADVLGSVSGEPDLSTPEAAKIAEGFRNAKLVRTGSYMMDYEMTIDGVTYSFSTVKEDGKWKITGL